MNRTILFSNLIARQYLKRSYLVEKSTTICAIPTRCRFGTKAKTKKAKKNATGEGGPSRDELKPFLELLDPIKAVDVYVYRHSLVVFVDSSS